MADRRAGAHMSGNRISKARRLRGSALVRTSLLVTAAALALVGCSSGSSGSPTTAAKKPTGPTKTVHVSAALGDGAVVGVGMPIVLMFTPAPTDSAAFTKAVKVTI